MSFTHFTRLKIQSSLKRELQLKVEKERRANGGEGGRGGEKACSGVERGRTGAAGMMRPDRTSLPRFAVDSSNHIETSAQQ